MQIITLVHGNGLTGGLEMYLILTNMNKVHIAHCRCNVMRETGIMVREPAVQIINCVKAMDLERPAVRFVVYSTVQYSTV